jgi:nucleotide-binding universal stress UspA family protein
MATGVSPPAIGELRAKIKEEVTDYLQAKVEELQAEGIEKVSLVGVEGRGPEEIIDLARRTTDNIVAMSTHGRSGIGRWVLGSVTDLEGGGHRETAGDPSRCLFGLWMPM